MGDAARDSQEDEHVTYWIGNLLALLGLSLCWWLVRWV